MKRPKKEKGWQKNIDDTLAKFYEEAVFIEKEKHVRINWLRGAKLLCRDGNIVFRLASDGQDDQYLEFYGSASLIDATIKDTLLPLLKEHFYIRQRQGAI